jgi:membrane carboxypeptidase/penicillin-binding protein PbpC
MSDIETKDSWSMGLDECHCNQEPCTCGIWVVLRDGKKMVGLRDYELAAGIVQRVNAAGLKEDERWVGK